MADLKFTRPTSGLEEKIREENNGNGIRTQADVCIINKANGKGRITLHSYRTRWVDEGYETIGIREKRRVKRITPGKKIK